MDLLFWLYLINSVILICHEIDSAYWHEWELFKLPGGIQGFLWFHVLIVPPILLGLVLVFQKTFSGSIISLILCATGIFAFGIHTYFLCKGRSEFNTAMSKGILLSTLLVSIIQASLTIVRLSH